MQSIALTTATLKEQPEAVSARLSDKLGSLVLPAQRNKKNEGGDSDARPTGVPAPPPKTDPQSAEIALQVRLLRRVRAVTGGGIAAQTVVAAHVQGDNAWRTSRVALQGTAAHEVRLHTRFEAP